MIDLGANPHIKNARGWTHFDVFCLSNLNNVSSVKSIFFPIRNFPTGNLGEPWCYTTGIYDGKFGRVIGKGGEGTVIQGIWGNDKAAFKFVQVRDQKIRKTVEDDLADMNARVREMVEMESINRSNILNFNGHFR